MKKFFFDFCRLRILDPVHGVKWETLFPKELERLNGWIDALNKYEPFQKTTQSVDFYMKGYASYIPKKPEEK